ncbi:MAG: carbohydrate porin [Betaproteobacteria bacterium]
MPFILSLLLWALLLPLPACAQDQESWNAHFQATYVRQVQPAFASPYSGSHSLSGAAGASYSVTGTAAFGLRLGPSTEAYLDPEVAQGLPFSGLVGLAAFPNGELAKTSGAQLTLYRARLFVRHTIGLGGEPLAVAGDANQLKSTYDSRRLVITAGNLSVLDLFDGNTLAHDPRTQFMNWTLMTHGAYDYPADARGYTDGVALEYDGGGWTTRFGRFAEPRVPNGLALDEHLGTHYGDQVELVHAHTVGGYAGAVRVLAFRSRARMAAYADALAAAPVGAAPSLAAVRDRDHVKAGVGVDVEQQLAPAVGVFLRALRADGRTETEAFTEADASLSLGTAIQGAGWSRAGDTVGIAGGADWASAAHRTYLARGGTTSFLGDGALRYGAERVVEVYYSAALRDGLSLTADFQRVINPGYNMDRGPASFCAIRLHWES